MPSPGRPRRIATVVRAGLTAVTAVIVLALVVPQLSSAWPTLRGLLPLAALAALGCQLVALALRAEVWRTCLTAVDGADLRRDRLHMACGAMYVCGLVARPLGQAARIAVLRRGERGRAPATTQMVAADAPPVVIEAALMLALVLVALIAGGDDWRLPALGLAACAAVALGLRRFALRRRGALRGLAVLRDGRRLGRLLLQVAGVLGLQLVRNMLLLEALGLAGGVRRAALLLAAMSAAGALPAGALGAPAGAFAVLAGGAGAATAGLAVLGVVVGAAVLYALPAGALRLAATRGRR